MKHNLTESFRMRQLLVCLPNRCLLGLAHPVPFQLRMLQDTRVRQRSIKVHDVRILNYISSFKRFQYVIIYQLHIELRDDINIYLTGVWLSRADTLPGPWVFSSVAMISYNTRTSVCSVFEYCCTSKHNPDCIQISDWLHFKTLICRNLTASSRCLSIASHLSSYSTFSFRHAYSYKLTA